MEWTARIPIPPQVALLEFADVVRQHSDKRKLKGPKWQFRVATDLVVQIQPMFAGEVKRGRYRYSVERSFEGLACQGIGVDARTLTDHRGARYMGFIIDTDWEFRGSQAGPLPPRTETVWHPEYPRPLSAEHQAEYKAEDRARVAALDALFTPLRDRVLSLFQSGFFERLPPGSLMGDHCICCDKPLSDPVSRARFIGRDCWDKFHGEIAWIRDLRHSVLETCH